MIAINAFDTLLIDNLITSHHVDYTYVLSAHFQLELLIELKMTKSIL